MDQSRLHLDDGDLRAKTPEHLAEFQAYVAAADDDEVWRDVIEADHRTVRQVWNAIQARNPRNRCASADVDEDAAGAQHDVANRDLASRPEPCVSLVDGARLQTAQHRLDAAARSFRDGVLPGLHALHVDADAA